MNRGVVWFVILCGLLGPGSAGAMTDDEYWRHYRASPAFAAAEDEINGLWKSFSERTRRELRAGQRAWLLKRDAAAPGLARSQGIPLGDALALITRERSGELRRLAGVSPPQPPSAEPQSVRETGTQPFRDHLIGRFCRAGSDDCLEFDGRGHAARDDKGHVIVGRYDVADDRVTIRFASSALSCRTVGDVQVNCDTGEYRAWGQPFRLP